MAKLTVSSDATKKHVGTPSDEFDSMRTVWGKCRAIIRGQESTKAYDEYVNDYDVQGVNRNLLLPFSPSMTQNQYDFFKGEAELPGITSQYAKSMIGALLRKDASLTLTDRLPDELREEITNWLRHELTADSRSMFHLLDDALWEEMQTGYCWIYVDTPNVSDEEYELMDDEQRAASKPYPVVLTAEKIINTIYGTHPITKKPCMLRFITRYFTDVFTPDNPWHPERVDTVRDHYIDEQGLFVVDEYRAVKASPTVTVDHGKVNNEELSNDSVGAEAFSFELFDTFTPTNHGERLSVIPAWPLDGEYDIEDPLLLTFVNREIGLYNKVSRRNHLMYGAATYTPIVIGTMDQEQQEAIVQSGLGTWLFLDEGCSADTLTPPTDSLTDMQTSIEATISEMARMGIRMLSPETVQSGSALELRNAGQNAMLGTLNMKVSLTLRHVFTFLINWRYNLDLVPDEVEFEMSSDFSPTAKGEDSMRLIGEWYMSGLIPRSVFIEAAKNNDYLAAAYADEVGVEELSKDPIRQMAMEMYEPDIEE